MVLEVCSGYTWKLYKSEEQTIIASWVFCIYDSDWADKRDASRLRATHIHTARQTDIYLGCCRPRETLSFNDRGRRYAIRRQIPPAACLSEGFLPTPREYCALLAYPTALVHPSINGGRQSTYLRRQLLIIIITNVFTITLKVVSITFGTYSVSVRSLPCWFILLLFFTHQHKAAGVKTKQNVKQRLQRLLIRCSLC